MVQWLRLHTANAGDASSIPGLETKISDTGSVAKGFGKKDYIFFFFTKKKRSGEVSGWHTVEKDEES